MKIIESLSCGLYRLELHQDDDGTYSVCEYSGKVQTRRRFKMIQCEARHELEYMIRLNASTGRELAQISNI